MRKCQRNIRFISIRFSNFVPKINDFGDPLTYDTCNDVALHHLNVLSEQLMSVLIEFVIHYRFICF